MIEWNMVLTKPAINTEDKHDNENGVSIRVVVRVIDDMGFCGFAFARYFHQSEHWIIEGYHGNCYKVTHWTSLNQPEN
jgi:hypothetical protein